MAPSTSDWIGWLEIAVEQVVLAAAFVMTYEGARRLAGRGFARWPALMLAVGLLIPVLEASASLLVPDRVRRQAVEQASMRAAEPPGGWEKAALSPADRTALSTNAAMINYLVLGRRGEVIDAAGHRVPFNPTQEQIQARESLVRDEKGAQDTGQQFFERGVRLFTDAAAAMLLGIGVGLGMRRVGRVRLKRTST
jgi:hypothetical protein